MAGVNWPVVLVRKRVSLWSVGASKRQPATSHLPFTPSILRRGPASTSQHRRLRSDASAPRRPRVEKGRHPCGGVTLVGVMLVSGVSCGKWGRSFTAPIHSKSVRAGDGTQKSDHSVTVGILTSVYSSTRFEAAARTCRRATCRWVGPARGATLCPPPPARNAST